jgi:eukaryotic-like serine/threonine-protein kinase
LALTLTNGRSYAQALFPPRGGLFLPPDQMVGPYRVIEKLGAGGMGEVYLAEDPRLGRPVALKRLTIKGVATDEQLRRLMQEGTAAAALNHPNIGAIYDVLEADGVAHIVMEYVPGETLASRLIRGPLPLDRVLHIGMQLCDGLAAAHARGIVHRDLKPSNVIVTADGQVKILDFGLAQRRAATPVDVTVTAGALAGAAEQIAGTPAYMAPEHLLGKKTDHRCDIYSLGVTLYQLATGRLPFEGDSFVSVALAVITGPGPDLTRELGPALGAIVGRAMARDPEDRYRSAREMRRDLEALVAVAAETPTVGGEAAIVPGPVTRQERRAFAWAASIVLVSALAAIVWWAIGRHTSLEAGGLPVIAVMPLETSSSDPRDATLGLGVGDALVSDLAGTRGIVVAPSRSDDGPPKRTVDVARVARALGASFVVDGGVQVVDEQVRINLRVMRPDGAAVRGVAEQGPRRDLLRLQRNLAVALIEIFGARPDAAERARIDAQPEPALDTIRTYSQARALLERRDVEGNLQRAIDMLAECVAGAPSFALAHAALAEAYWAQYQVTKDDQFVQSALAAAQRAVNLAPLQPDAHYALALIYKGMGQLDRAAAELRRSIATRPDHDGTHRLLGEVIAEQGRTEEGIAEIERAIRVRPAYPGNYTSLGLVYLRAARYEEAATAFAQVTRLEPQSPEAHTRLGAAYQYLGKNRDAMAAYRQATQLGGNPSAIANLALLEYRAGRYREAAQGYAEATRRDPNNPVGLRNLGDAYRKVGRGSDARAAYEQGLAVTDRMLAVNPKNAQTLQARGMLLAKLGRSGQAIAALDEAVRLAPNDAEALYDRAVVLVLAGDKAAALTALERAVTAGYPAEEVRRDDEWTRVADEGRFRALVAGQQ